MKSRDLLSVADMSAAEAKRLLARALKSKQDGVSPAMSEALTGKTLALVFEKPSLRTRVSFEVAMGQLGGRTIYLSPAEVGLGQREPVQDAARVLSRFVHAIAARTFAHETVALLARFASVPVINALSDGEHPCQALADLLTIYEKKGRLKGVSVAYVGDGNNVANSLMLACALCGLEFRFAGPRDYWLSDEAVRRARVLGGAGGGVVSVSESVDRAVVGADVVYTDVWTSMGQEQERARRQHDFHGYQVDSRLLSMASRDVLLMHPMPVHYGDEMADGMSDHPRSVLFDQAENRLHVQRQLLLDMLA